MYYSFIKLKSGNENHKTKQDDEDNSRARFGLLLCQGHALYQSKQF